MSLGKALESLPGDRATQAAVREVLLALGRHVGEALPAARVADAAGISAESAATILEVLCEGRVVRRGDDSGRYVYSPDRVVSLDVDTFVRRVGSRTGMLQDNLGRFRERYGR